MLDFLVVSIFFKFNNTYFYLPSLLQIDYNTIFAYKQTIF
nr:MAG TPA: hypothetical protein [Caudoviricetes sp.]